MEGLYLEGFQLCKVKDATGEVLKTGFAEIQLLNCFLEVPYPLRKMPKFVL